MLRDSVHGHGSAFPSTSPVLNTAPQRPAVLPHHQTEGNCGPTALEANGKEFKLGLASAKVHPCAAEILLRGQVKKLKEKATPYMSKQGSSGVELNGQVPVKPSQASAWSSETVVCRHLATTFATHNGKKSEMMQTFSEEDGIAATFDGKLTEIDVAFERTLRETSSACKHLVSSEQIGSYLMAVATQLQAPGSRQGPSQANCLLLTAGHAMALHVERKVKNRVEYFSAKLYDPNATATYRRVVKETPEDFGNLKLKDMMIDPQLIELYANGKNRPVSMVALCLDDRLQPPMERSSTTPSAESMHVALQCGVLEEVHAILKFSLQACQAPDDHIELLRASFLFDGLAFPGLYSALQYGQSDVVRAFAQEVLASSLSPQAKVALLAATSSDGVPGLQMALDKGKSDAVRAFAQEVLASNLSPQAKFDLLAAKRSDGISGLYLALQEGQADAVKAFTQEVLVSNLSEQAKVDLLAAKRSNGCPGLFTALHLGHADAVKAFALEVLVSNLSEQAKVDLLAATSNGRTGLSVAREQGHTAAVKAFTDMISVSGLSQQAKDKLLSDMTDHHIGAYGSANFSVGPSAPLDILHSHN